MSALLQPALEPLVGFEILSYPRFEGEAAAEEAARNLAGQRDLWSSVRFLGSNIAIAWCAELRLTAHRESRRISAILVVHGSRDSEQLFAGAARLFANGLSRMLPPDYVWRQLTDTELAAGLHGPLIGEVDGKAPWATARVVRRIRLLEAPPVNPEQFSGSPQQDLRRSLPPVDMPPALEADHGALCIPYMAPLVPSQVDRHGLFQELLRSAPAAVSIVLQPVERNTLHADRITAAHLRSWLTRGAAPTLGMSNNPTTAVSMLSDSSASLGQDWQHAVDFLNAFHSPDERLARVAIRAAALTTSAAISVGLNAASTLGGVNAFTVFWDADRALSLKYLACSRNVVLAPEVAREIDRLEHCEHYAAYLSRVPDIWSEDDAFSALQLPFATERGLPGVRSSLVPPFYEPPLSASSAATTLDACIKVGVVEPMPSSTLDAGEARAHRWHALEPVALTKHALLVGNTGSGKSTTTQNILSELNRLRIPFLVIEPVKAEYAERLAEIGVEVRRYGFERRSALTPEMLGFDPLRLPGGISVARHVSYLMSCFEAAWPLTDFFSLLLENGLRAYYTAAIEEGGCGLGLFSTGGWRTVRLTPANTSNGATYHIHYPSFRHFQSYFLNHFLPAEARGLANESTKSSSTKVADDIAQWSYAFRRRFRNLEQSPFGECIRHADERLERGLRKRLAARSVIVERRRKLKLEEHREVPFGDARSLLRRNTVVELESLSDSEDKALVMAFLLTMLYEKRQSEDADRRRRGESSAPALRHVVVVEEAHRVLPNQARTARSTDLVGATAQGKALSLFVDMLAEIRAYGQGLVVVEQIPTKLATDVVKNTNLKLMMRLTAKEDRNYLGDAMSFTERQKAFVNNLKPGQAVAFDESVDQPVLLRIPLPEVLGS